MFKNLTPRTEIYEVWNRFISGGDSGLVPLNIRSSWERCRKAGINPRKETTPMRIDQNGICKRLDDHLDLHQILRSHHKNMEKNFSFLPVGIFFADRDGFILSIAGDDKIIKACSQIVFIGSSVKEHYVGTTAPGLCLEENRFAAVHAEEHYNQSIHWASCIASPIYDGGNNLLGTLDFTVSLEDWEKLKQLIPILISTANSIQFELSLKERLDHLELFHSYYRSTFDYSQSILVLTDSSGGVIDLNQKAQEFFKINSQEITHRNIKTILGNKPKIDILFKGSGGKISLDDKHLNALSAESMAIFDRSGKEIAFLLKLEKEKGFKALTKRADQGTRYTFNYFIGASPKLITVVEKARKAANTRSTILIEGETGTGKELFAQAIHSESPFKSGPFIALNCGAIPRDLIESELFGYEKGAYTGAKQEGNAGKFELADGGTIFLDEIHLMDLPAQAKILRVLEDRRVSRIGAKNDLPLNIRVIAASTENLMEEMAKDRFVPALFFRLNVVRLCLPPLRERKEDIPLLVDYFINEMNRIFNRSIRGIEPEALKVISQYPWPGNVRELRNCIESIFNFSTGETIGLNEVSDVIPLETKARADQGQTMEEITRNSIIGALNRFGNVKGAAHSLGIPLTTFYRKMKEFDLST